MNLTPLDRRLVVIERVMAGASIRAAARDAGIHRDTAMMIVRRLGGAASLRALSGIRVPTEIAAELPQAERAARAMTDRPCPHCRGTGRVRA